MWIENLYDSHVHFAGTGQVACEVDLAILTSREDLKNISTNRRNFRGDWLVGFGWDETKWSDPKVWTREELDQYFPTTPVYFSRCDGHSAVINSLGMKRLGLGTGATGRLFETEHYTAYAQLPALTEMDVESHLREAMALFNRSGFTHIRDMGGTLEQWTQAQRLESEGEQTLFVDWNIACEDMKDYDKTLENVLYCRAHESDLNKVAGIKFYYDGSLGSETALLSQPYSNRTDQSKGMTCWPLSVIEEGIRKAWDRGVPAAIHAIGDEAADHIVEVARNISSSGLGGKLHLEHVELLRPETIQKMKGLHVTCHLQPCHWLTDHRWLQEKTGELAGFAFQWEALRRARIPFYFGSDSPIEKPSFFSNLDAVAQSAQHGVPALGASPIDFHRYPKSGSPAGRTLVDLEKKRILEVWLQDRLVYRNDPPN